MGLLLFIPVFGEAFQTRVCQLVHSIYDYTQLAVSIYEIAQHVTEMNDPQKLMDDLEKLVDKINEGELPKTKKEFMSQAELYHTLMDLEEFLMYKKRFIQEIDDIQFQIYWKKEVEGK